MNRTQLNLKLPGFIAGTVLHVGVMFLLVGCSGDSPSDSPDTKASATQPVAQHTEAVTEVAGEAAAVPIEEKIQAQPQVVGPALPHADPDSAEAIGDQLRAMGIEPETDGVSAALKSGNESAQDLALQFATAEKIEGLEELVRPLLDHPDPVLREHGAEYMAVQGFPVGIAMLHGFADLTQDELVLHGDLTLQLICIGAARTLASIGYPGYVYQISYLLENGKLLAREKAAGALGEFLDVSDPMTEYAWWVGLSVFVAELEHEDSRVRLLAPEFGRALLASASTLETMTPNLLNVFRICGDKARASDLEEIASGFDEAVARLSEVKEVKVRDDHPGTDPDPRIEVRKLAIKILRNIDGGAPEKMGGTLDMDYGKFEGLDGDQWVKKLSDEYVEYPEGVGEGIVNVRGVASRPDTGIIDLKFFADVFDVDQSLWNSVQLDLEFTWWGFGWHLHRFDQHTLYPLLPVEPGEFNVLLDYPPRYEPVVQVVLGAFQAIDQRDIQALIPLLAEDGIFRDNQTKDQLVAQLGKQFEEIPVSSVRFLPTKIAFSSTSENEVTGNIEIAGLSVTIRAPARVLFQFHAVKRQGRWILVGLDDISHF